MKLDIKERDKVPNYDGFIEVLDPSLRPLGKLEVQIKSLSDKDVARKGFSCELALLAYAQTAPLPFLLIGVSVAKRQALWVELTPAVCGSLLAKASGATVTARFPEPNLIAEGRSDQCLEEFVQIVSRHLHKVVSFDKLAEEVIRLRKIEQAVSTLGTGLPVDDSVGMAEIQAHLSELNRLLDSEYQLVKQTFFPNAWQLGLAFAEYTDTSAAYCYFAIRRGTNDVAVKKLSSSAFRALQLERTSWRQLNPINVVRHDC